MKTRMAFALGLCILAGAAAAQQLPRRGNAQAAQAPQTQLSRHAAVKQLVLKWGQSASREQGVNIYRWADNMVPLFRSADIHNLNNALTAKSYTDMVMTMTGSKTMQAGKLPGGLAPKSLGSLTSDLVYTPLASCLLLDTRVVGGPFTAGTVRHYKGSGANFTAQGGSNTNCGIPAGVNALVVTVSSINATAKGYFRMWPYGTTMPAASVMSYGPTQNTQNNIVLATTVGDTADFSVQSAAGSHLVVAVLGYFAAPEATALACTTVNAARSLAIGFNGYNYATAACPSGYSAVSPYCWAASASGVYSGGSGVNPTAFCEWKNLSGAVQTVYEGARCCRVPGR